MNLIAGFTAFFLGALHALEPGHGKSAIAAYAVGYRSSLSQILVLGLSAAIAHTATILALALILGATVSAANDAARQYIEIGSAALLVGTGAWLWQRARKAKKDTKDCDNPAVECGCHRAKQTVIDDEKPVTFGAASLLGISVGLLPCPTALAVLINSMTAGHFFGGLWTVCLFSIGIALTVSAVALGAYLLTKSPLAARFQNYLGKSNWVRNVPVFSALIVIGSGFFTLFRAIYHP